VFLQDVLPYPCTLTLCTTPLLSPTLLPRSLLNRVLGFTALLFAYQAVDDIAVYTEVSTQSVADAQIKLDKPRVVVLGSGWASACFMKALPKDIK
jgi:hypothetical protein